MGVVVKWVSSIAATEFGVDQVLSRNNHNRVLDTIALAIDTVLAPPGILVIPALVFLYLLFFLTSLVNAVAACPVVALGWLSNEVFKVIVSHTLS